MTALRDAFALIRDEAKTFDVFDEETLRVNFSDDVVYEELLSIGREWGETAQTLDGRLEEDDGVGFRRCLLELETLNNRYRAIIAARYAEALNAAEA